MTVSTTSNRISYNGDNTTTVFSFPYKFLDVADIKVFVGGVLQTITTDYSVGTPSDTGANITFVSAPAVGTNNVVFVRESDLLQQAALKSNGKFPAETVEDMIDKLTLIVQRLEDKFNQSLVVPDDENLTAELPDKATRAGKYLSFDDVTGDPEVVNAVVDVTTVAGIAGNVNTVAGIAPNVTTVAGISANVTTVAGISANVSTVATNSANVTTAATNIASINTVAADLNEPVSEIDTVATNIANVNTVGNNIASVNTAAGNNANITTVATNIANVNTTATNIANVNAVAGNATNINAVAGNSTNINSVASNSTNINTAATNMASIVTVASDLNEPVSEIDTVATNIANVNAVGSDIASVNTVAVNIVDVHNFADVYQGAKSTPPTLRNDGSALQIGDLYFNSVSNAMFVYASTGWVPAGSSVNGTSRRFRYIATAGQTTFTGSDSNGNTMAYDAGFVDVYLNGVRLDQTDYTASSGTSIVLASAAALNDELNIVAFGTFSVASINGVDIINGTVSANKFASDAPAGVSDKNNTSTGYFDLPAGTTAQRPGSANVGYIRYNTTLEQLEMYDGSEWVSVKSIFTATGGTITDAGGFRYHTFTTSGTFQVTKGVKTIDYLIVAGGGAGGWDWSGGGGAGGYLSGSTSVSVNSYTVTVGAGGAVPTNVSTKGFNGANSSAFSLTAIGGGGGGSDQSDPGASGGSGGGGAIDGGGGSGTAGQGNAGAGGNRGDSLGGGGGGGAGAAGSVSSGSGGNGGVGLQWSNGTFYAGGGGGGRNGTAGTGGAGGGGNGGNGSNAGLTAGSANTGGGGGGGGAGQGAAGGSGVVIIRYQL